MVASDTVVGIVGAGVLLVALIGVFIIESKEPSTAGNEGITARDYSGTAAGEVSSHAETGTPVGTTGQCAYQTGTPVRACEGPGTAIDLTLNGLPMPSAGTGLVYTGYLVNPDGGEPKEIGELTRAGTNYSVSASFDTDDRAYKILRVTLGPANGTGLLVYEHNYGGITENPGGSRSLDKTFSLAFTAGNLDYDLTEADNGVTAKLSLTDAKNNPGFVYAGWIYDAHEGETHYTYLGDFEAPADAGATFGATLTSTVADHELDSVAGILVSLEVAGHATELAMPSGLTAFEAMVE